jgi:hypothetical protein
MRLRNESSQGGPCAAGRPRWLESDLGIWSGREDLNLDSFPGREACCNYTTSAEPASVEPDKFEV